MITKINVTLRRNNNIFKIIITFILKKFYFQMKVIYFQDRTQSLIIESKFR